MFPKTLFTVFDSYQSANSLKGAIDLASEYECHLSVAVVGIALPVSASAYGAIPADAWAQEREEGLQTTKAKAEEIEKLLADAGISGDVATYFTDEGQIATMVGTRARYSDLGLIIPSEDMDGRLASHAQQGLLFQSSKPFLVVPHGTTANLRPKTVMVAWDAGCEAASAVHMSLDMLIAADAVHVAMVDPVATEYGQGEEPGADIAAYLARHGVNVTVDVLSGGSRSIADVLIQHAADINAQIMVAGAYGHSRIREYFFGGTTRDLLANEKIPLLMAH